jgi:hypothetical protein
VLLQTLLSFTPLRGIYGQIPTNITIMQVTVFFAVSWFIAALFGGLHYWLMRRDMRSAIRAFFLNITELIVAPLAVEPEPAQPTSVTIPPTIDEVLDDLLAGKITRDEAAKRIQSIMSKVVTRT